MIYIFQKLAFKRIINLITSASDDNFIRFIEVVEKYFIRNKDNKTANTVANTIKKAFKEKHPSLELFKSTFNRISPNCRDRIIENLLINTGIFAEQKRKALKKKLSFSVPGFIAISPTATCNLNCVGCYASEYTRRESLSFEVVDRILTEAKVLGTYFITIIGGEPFIWPGILEMFEKHNDMYFQIYTNGTLINNEIAERLSNIGNVAPAVSIEGFEKETDERRGVGTFRKVMSAMDNLYRAGVIFGFSATVTKQNSEVLISDEFIDLMILKGCTFGLYFQYIPIGRNPDINLMCTPEQRNIQRVKVNQIMKKKPILLGDFWNYGPQVGGCLAGARPGGYFHINSKGDVEPCVFLPFSVDNIKEKKLIDVIQSPFFKSIQKEQPYCQNNNLLTPCPLIDNPWAIRKVVGEFNVKLSYNGAENVISDPKITTFLDNYSKKYKKITDPIWENELSHRYKHWRDGG
ncbi:MAG: radical SAM protein [Candidatus Helarchaeota archaeon]|nr:radical SAM protein [Candidatus Helarchaeota archaeon]